MLTKPSTDTFRRNNRFTAAVWGLMVVLLIAVILRTHRIEAMSFWFDESFCLKMAEFPISELWIHAKGDPHPPFFYFVLRYWMLLFGASTFVTRLTSLIPGMLSIVGIFLVVREAYRNQTTGICSTSVNTAAVVAASLVALSPLHILWSYQVRMYALGTALAAFSSWFLLKVLLRTQPQKRDWYFFTLTAIALIYTHNFGLFVVTAQYLFAAGYLLLHQRTSNESNAGTRFLPLIISAACTGFIWLPWLPSFLHQRQLVVEGFWTKPFTWKTAGATLFDMFGFDQAMEMNPIIGLIIGQISLLVLLLLALGRRPGDYFLALTAGLPFVIGILVSIYSRNIFNDRYFMFNQIFLFAAFAVLISRVQLKTVQFSLFGFCVIGTGFLSYHQWLNREADFRLPAIQGAMASVDERRKPGELLLVCDPAIYVSVIAHTRERKDIFTFHSGEDYPFTHGAAAMREDEYLKADEIAQRADSWIWAFDADSYNWKVPIPAGYKLVGENRFPGFRGKYVVRLYLSTSEEAVSAN
ncbi:glycosyltransferase family 39 protein [Gimesia aquarii]|uniref:Glycosyltransferase RgtA/B/C/D-like domain-containing protein n=1 Tax=Gimesia aquarii TaxID=2527964 RepID=A0A517VU46_9PLAN|nr:glycosyltransferase family 39 protein [Gimesia aquarii]QDT96527.1 hypothetical protein V144x_19840 [Gimesia aquarii]